MRLLTRTPTRNDEMISRIRICYRLTIFLWAISKNVAHKQSHQEESINWKLLEQPAFQISHHIDRNRWVPMIGNTRRLPVVHTLYRAVCSCRVLLSEIPASASSSMGRLLSLYDKLNENDSYHLKHDVGLTEVVRTSPRPI